MGRKVRVGAVVLAAGSGTRMHAKLPKVLHPICGRPMIDYPVQALRQAGIEQILVVINPRMNGLVTHLKQLEIKRVTQLRPQGTAHAVTVARSALRPMPDHLLIMYGDVPLVTPQLVEQVVSQHLARQAACTLVSAELADPAGYGRIIRDEHGRLSAILEENEASVLGQMVNEVNAGLYCFQTKALFEVLKQVKPDRTTHESYLTQAIRPLARQSPVESILLKGSEVNEVLGVNTQEEFTRVNELMRQRLIRQHQDRGVTILDPDSTYIEEGVVIGSGTVIKPFSHIEAGVKIGERCSVGPFAHLRQGTVVDDGVTIGNFVEIVRSRIGPETKVLHQCYLGDAIIGTQVNIGAGTITANYDGTGKFQTVIEDGSFIGSGTIFVAPVIVRRRAITGAGAVLTRNTEVGPGETFIGVPAKRLDKAIQSVKRKA